jgi:hypothetical protein
MLIKVPDSYRTVLPLLENYQVPYQVVKEEYKSDLEKRAETLHALSLINLDKLDFTQLIEEALLYMNEKTKVDPATVQHLLNESLKEAYNKIVE